MTPFEPSWSRAVYHLYVIRAADREGMMSLPEEGRNRYRNPLPDSIASTESLCIAELSRRRFPGGGESGGGNCLLANVSSYDRSAASQGRGRDPQLCFQFDS